jgi:hypothetical protein
VFPQEFAVAHPLYYSIPTMLDEDCDLKTKIADVLECASKEIIALVEKHCDGEKSSAEPLPEWMTAAQLARYWQLINASGEAITAGIMKWTKRAENEHPLPNACMGDLLRFKREDVDRWAQEEAAFRTAEESKETASRKLKRRPDSSSSQNGSDH